MTSDAKELKKMGSLLKKNNIAVDVVVMGEHEEVQEKMAELVNAANTNDNRYGIDLKLILVLSFDLILSLHCIFQVSNHPAKIEMGVVEFRAHHFSY